MKSDKYESNVGHMPELTDFNIVHCAIGKQLILDMSMKDTLAGLPHIPITEYPDMLLPTVQN